MKLKCITRVIMLLSISAMTSAQQIDTTLWSGGRLIEEGTSLYDEGKYTKAEKFFERVSKCDPRYPLACYEAALNYEAKGEYSKGLKKILEADSLQPNTIETIVLKGSLLDDLERYSEATQLLETALVKWPYNQLLLYNLAIVYANTKDYDKSEALLERSIRVSPYHANTHILLGRINYYMGRTAQSILAFNMGLLVNPSNSNVSKFEQTVTGSSSITPQAHLYPYQSKLDESNWAELNRFCRSEIAFKKDFPYNFPTNFLINRKSFMLFELMKYESNNSSIYNQLYIRFFKELTDRKQLDALFAFELQGTSNENASDWLKANKTKKDKLVEVAQQLLNEWRGYNYSIGNETNKIKTHLTNNDGKLTLIGTQIQGEKPSLHGSYVRLNNEGQIIEKGTYKNNELDGICKILWPNGTVKQDLLFSNGNLMGENKTFHENGRLSGVYPRVNDKKEGLEKQFLGSGRLYSSANFINDKIEGVNYNYYYRSGWMSEISYTNNKIEGLYLAKWLNNMPKAKGLYSDSLLNGEFAEYYRNGNIESAYNYKKGNTVGVYKNYHTNGKIKNQGYYNDSSKLEGAYKEYNRVGTKIREQTAYVNGILNGTNVEYYKNGKKKDESTFANGILKKLVCYNEQGKIIYQTDETNGEIKIKTFYENAALKREGSSKNGKREGVWKNYSPAGVIVAIENWKDDMQVGEQKYFYQSGSVKSAYVCDSYRIHGKYTAYHPNGISKSELIYDKGQVNGEIKIYYSNGQLANQYYYEQDEIAGTKYDYTVEGNLSAVTNYSTENEITKTSTYYNNKLLKTVNYEQDSAKVEIQFPNSRIMTRYTIIDGTIHGLVENFYPNAKIRDNFQYVYGSINGPSKRWDINGKLESTHNYMMGKLEGSGLRYIDGVLTQKTVYEDGLEQERYNEYYPNGKVFRSINYLDGEREGAYHFFSPDSTLLFSINYEEEAISSISIRNNQGVMENIQSSSANNTSIISYYPNGKVAAIVPFNKGILNGKLSLYYPNGTILRERQYVNDYIEGVSLDYYSNGKLRQREEYRNNDLNGMYQGYYENGQLKEEGKMIADCKTGIWIKYDIQGKPSMKIVYEDNIAYEIN